MVKYVVIHTVHLLDGTIFDQQMHIVCKKYIVT
jgi:hypothetical protein